MVTQLYTVPVKLYGNVSATNGVGGAGLGVPVEANDGTNPDGQGNQAATFAAVQDQNKHGIISINSVVSDFQNTMDALGVTSSVRGEISPYLQVIAHQAQKDSPSTGVIKQNLRAAADTMDSFISDTLGQKSTVVKEWVDALLVQPIQYHASQPITLQSANLPSTSLASSANTAVFQTASSASTASSLSLADQENIKQQLQTAVQQAKSGQYDAAMGTYQGVLAQVDGNNQPEITGRVFYRMGQVLDKTNQPQAAQSCYTQAAEVLQETNSQPGLQAKVAQALAKNAASSGDTETAAYQYQQAIAFNTQAGDTVALTFSQNQLAQLYIQIGQISQAQPLLLTAASNLDLVPASLGTAVLNNLGSVTNQLGDSKQALGYYKQSLALSTSNNLPTQQAWQGMASLYLAANQPTKAYAALQNALS